MMCKVPCVYVVNDLCFLCRSGTNSIAAGCDFPGKGWLHRRPGLSLWWNSYINGVNKLGWHYLLSSLPLQPPPQENTTIAEDKKKTLVDCALFMVSFLQWDLATLERCSATCWGEILASFPALPCLLVCILSTQTKEIKRHLGTKL